MEMNSREDHEQIELPPGFRFHPTDEELITHYLGPKVLDSSFSALAVGEVDLNKCEPWDLPWRAKMGEKEWYFFCVRDRKYPTGLRTNRATEAGYWKATGKDKEIYRGKALVGMKKTLVFYKGRAPKGEKTNWVMHEYRLEGKYSAYNLPKTAKNEWVICRIFQKSSGGKKIHISGLTPSSLLPPLMDSSPPSTAAAPAHVTCFSSDAMEEYKSFNTSSSSNPSDMSNPSPFINKTHHQNPFFSLNFQNNFHFQDSFMAEQPEDQSILRMLVDNNGGFMKRNTKAEVSQDTAGVSADISSVISADNPSTSNGAVDHLDYLWNY